MTGSVEFEMPAYSSSFGENSRMPDEKTYQTIKTIAITALVILGIVAVGSTVALCLVLCPPVGAAIGISIGTAASILAPGIGLGVAGMIAATVVFLRNRDLTLGVVDTIKERLHFPKTDEEKRCEGIPFTDSMEGFQAKLKLIRAAEHNIVISGNYCGGATFTGVLDAVNEQMKMKPDLNVVILSSDNFIDPLHYKQIEVIRKEFPGRFDVIVTGSSWYFGKGMKLIQNHSKAVVIDYGRFFILGGSGLEDKYSVAKGMWDSSSSPNSAKTHVSFGRKLASLFLPTRGFRDQDFLFRSPEKEGHGKKVYLEILLLAARFNALNHGISFTKDQPTDPENCLPCEPLKTLLKENIEEVEPDNISNILDAHITASSKSGEIKILIQGPEHERNPFEEELLQRINNASRRILITHMYFHPTDKILKALASAAERGVSIKILTNGNEKFSPGAHRFFGERNRYNYRSLCKSISDEYKKNLEVYEFQPRKTTLHKKVVVIDDAVIAGSSNLGYKSLVTMSDYEINFSFQNASFADETAEIIKLEMTGKTTIQTDQGSVKKSNGKKINLKKKLSLMQVFNAARHRLMAPMIG
jgi:phosphatidylserine/phosphatidylglycerophosphate/cardiolipin synthase-like enzyme